MSVVLDLGDIAFVVEHTPRITTENPPAEQTSTHQTDTGRALSLVAHDNEALMSFLDAEQIAPQLVRHSSVVREAVKVMHRRAPVTSRSHTSPLAGLAERCRAVA